MGSTSESDRRWRRWSHPHARLGQLTFVMATGIVSTALHNTGADLLSGILLAVATVGYFVLIALVGLRWTRRPHVVLPDLREGRWSILAFTAASGVLGSRFSAMGIGWAALTLTIVTVISWVILGYLALALTVIGPHDSTSPRGLHSVDGTWFLMVVATQAVAVATGAYAATGDHPLFALAAALSWSVGVVLLGILFAIVGARLITLGLSADDEVSPYWVFMGAAAISVLAAAELLAIGGDQDWLSREAIASVSTVLWSFATWLLPLLIVLSIWHEVRGRVHTGFRGALWAMVFPIGMYGEASRELGRMREIGWLEDVGLRESWFAFAIWLVVCVGMLLWWRRWLTDDQAARAST